MTRAHPYRDSTLAAVAAIGGQIAVARRELLWTSALLAEQTGVSPALIRRIEAGRPTVGVGSVFEAAIACGVPLFGVEAGELGRVAARQRDRLALLPSRVRTPLIVLDDDF